MGFIREYVLSELKLKIISIVLACLLWFAMTYVGETKIAFSVPVSLSKLNRSFIIRETDTKQILITVNGPLSVLKNLRPDDFRVTLDLASAKEGRQTLMIKKGDVIVPNNVKIESIRPDYVAVEIDKMVEKRLRTVVKLDERWVGAYKVVSWFPQSVYAEGPEGLLDKRDSLDTLPIEGSLKQQVEILDVPLDLRSLEAVKVKPDMVRVTLRRAVK
jgi:YbbR domain-containing protein